MKHSLHIFLITYLYITANTSLAMELEKPKETKPNILAEITCIQNPKYAQYLANNHVVIVGEDGCSIVDPKTNTDIKKISNIGNQKIAIHPNQKLFALFYDNIINIYDIEKNDYIWNKKVEGSLPNCEQPYDRIASIQFDPHDTTIFLMRANFKNYTEGKNYNIPMNHKITKYNYITNQDDSSSFGYNGRTPIIAINPTQHEICIVHPNGATYHPTNHSDEFLPQTRASHNFGRYYKDFCEYNPNGSYIAQGDHYHSNIYIVNSQNINQCKKLTTKYYNDRILHEEFKKTVFYSNSILAISSKLIVWDKEVGLERKITGSHTLLSYWNIDTKELIHVSPQLPPSETYDFSFSPDKTKVIIALKDECVILPVPFKVMDKDTIKNIFSYHLFLIKNYTSQCDAIEIPQDVTYLIGNLLLELYKRQ